MSLPLGQRSHPSRRNAAAARVAMGYVLLATLVIGLATALGDGVPWVHPNPWLPMSPPLSLVTSAATGLAFAVAIIAVTRVTVTRFEWARRLHGELRPVARNLSVLNILVLAGLSSLGEELLFRGLLLPWLGVAGSAVLFGLAHQIRGPSRWVWAGWATAVGIGLGAIFAATGSLLGPLLAHAVVNAVNLSYLRDHEPLTAVSS